MFGQGPALRVTVSKEAAVCKHLDDISKSASGGRSVMVDIMQTHVIAISSALPGISEITLIETLVLKYLFYKP